MPKECQGGKEAVRGVILGCLLLAAEARERGCQKMGFAVRCDYFILVGIMRIGRELPVRTSGSGTSRRHWWEGIRGKFQGRIGCPRGSLWPDYREGNKSEFITLWYIHKETSAERWQHRGIPKLRLTFQVTHYLVGRIFKWAGTVPSPSWRVLSLLALNQLLTHTKHFPKDRCQDNTQNMNNISHSSSLLERWERRFKTFFLNTLCEASTYKQALV